MYLDFYVLVLFFILLRGQLLPADTVLGIGEIPNIYILGLYLYSVFF